MIRPVLGYAPPPPPPPRGSIGKIVAIAVIVTAVGVVVFAYRKSIAQCLNSSLDVYRRLPPKLQQVVGVVIGGVIGKVAAAVFAPIVVPIVINRLFNNGPPPPPRRPPPPPGRPPGGGPPLGSPFYGLTGAYANLAHYIAHLTAPQPTAPPPVAPAPPPVAPAPPPVAPAAPPVVLTFHGQLLAFSIAVRNGTLTAPFTELKQYWARRSRDEKKQFVECFSADEPNFDAVRRELASTVYRSPLGGPRSTRQAAWLSSREVDQHIQTTLSITSCDPQSFYYHPTDDTGLQDILSNQAIPLRKGPNDTAPGAFVSTQLEPSFGRYILAFKKGIERSGELSVGYHSDDVLYRAGFAQPLPVTDATLAYIILCDDPSSRLVTCTGLQADCTRWARRPIQVFSYRVIEPQLAAMQGLGMGIPAEWPRDTRTHIRTPLVPRLPVQPLPLPAAPPPAPARYVAPPPAMYTGTPAAGAALVPAGAPVVNLADLVARVKAGTERAPFDGLRDFWTSSTTTVDQKRLFAVTFSGSDPSFSAVRQALSDLVYRPACFYIATAVHDVWERAISDPASYYYHATRTEDSLQSILRSQKIEVRQRGVFRGAFVSTQPEHRDFYGCYVFALRRNIERVSLLMKAIPKGGVSHRNYWAGFSQAIPVNENTLDAILLNKDPLHSETERAALECRCSSWAGRHIQVLLLDAALLANICARRDAMYIPNEWPYVTWPSS